MFKLLVTVLRLLLLPRSRLLLKNLALRQQLVGASDLLSLLVQWGTDPGGPPDFDGDGSVGTSDLLALLANWGPCP